MKIVVAALAALLVGCGPAVYVRPARVYTSPGVVIVHRPVVVMHHSPTVIHVRGR